MGLAVETSAPAAELSKYLKSCVSALANALALDAVDADLDPWAEHPGTDVGKHIRCLAQHRAVKSLVSLFYGLGGSNGVFSAALGLRARAADPNHVQS